MTDEIDEALIERLVHTFYGRVQADAWVGPIFDARIRDWDKHLRRMCDFWSSVTLRTGTFQGQAMRIHLRLPVDGSHFDRWVALFEATAREVCPPQAAEVFVGCARQIAESLELGIASASGQLLQKAQRCNAKGSRYRNEALVAARLLPLDPRKGVVARHC